MAEITHTKLDQANPLALALRGEEQRTGRLLEAPRALHSKDEAPQRGHVDVSKQG